MDFEGDVAIKELRERLALAPDHIPEPVFDHTIVARMDGINVHLNAHDVDQASKIIEGTARSMGVEVV